MDRATSPPRARSFGIASDERFRRLLRLVEADRLPPAVFGAQLDKGAVMSPSSSSHGTGCGQIRRAKPLRLEVNPPNPSGTFQTYDNQTKTPAARDDGKGRLGSLAARSDIEAIPFDQAITPADFHRLLADADGVGLGLTPFGEAELAAARRCGWRRATAWATTAWMWRP